MVERSLSMAEVFGSMPNFSTLFLSFFFFLFLFFLVFGFLSLCYFAEMTSKVLCEICKRGKGTFKCEGCATIFCPKHSIDHRSELSKQLEDIEIEYDRAYKNLVQQTQNLRQHALVQKVDQWEQKSIEQIRQLAEQTRNELLTTISNQNNDVKQKLQELFDELQQAREDNDFLENDLQEWTRKLEIFKSELVNPVNIEVQESSTALVNQIHIDRQISSQKFDENPSIESNHREIRGQNKYQTGCEKINFQIEQIRENDWFAVGILSASENKQNNLYSTSSSFGWSNQNEIIVAGQLTNQQTFDLIQNDQLILSIDCDQNKIQLTNQRLNQTVELTIDIDKCPLPWQYFLTPTNSNTDIRVLN